MPSISRSLWLDAGNLAVLIVVHGTDVSLVSLCPNVMAGPGGASANSDAFRMFLERAYQVASGLQFMFVSRSTPIWSCVS